MVRLLVATLILVSFLMGERHSEITCTQMCFTETAILDPAQIHDLRQVQEDDPEWNCATMGNGVCGEIR